MCFGLVNFPGHFARRLSAISALGVADKQTEIHLDSDSLSKSWRSPTKAYLRQIAWFFNHSQSNCKARVAGELGSPAATVPASVKKVWVKVCGAFSQLVLGHPSVNGKGGFNPSTTSQCLCSTPGVCG